MFAIIITFIENNIAMCQSQRNASGKLIETIADISSEDLPNLK